jgi:hypothetical protein
MNYNCLQCTYDKNCDKHKRTVEDNNPPYNEWESLGSKIGTIITERQAHEKASGMALCDEFFTINKINPGRILYAMNKVRFSQQ